MSSKFFVVDSSKAIILLAMMQVMAATLQAQDVDTASANIQIKIDNNKANFNSTLRPLHQIAGAPSAFYTHFWEFGDGKFSFEANPSHVYSDTGNYNVIYYATNNYDDGKPPPRRRKRVSVNSNLAYAEQSTPSFFKEGGAIEMKVNRMPRADEDLVLIIGYRNQRSNTAQSGSLVLFYNEKQFRANSFQLAEERAYYGEKVSSIQSIAAIDNEITEAKGLHLASGPSAGQDNQWNDLYAGKVADLLRSKQRVFRQNNAWKFEGLQKYEEKYFFLTLHTMPEMIKDTNGVVTITGMFIPDDGGDLEEYELELQIVASHDPNRMILRNRRLNYRFTSSHKEMTYRVKFQNTGKGPAQQIMVGIKVPGLLNERSVKLIDQYPGCIPCDSAAAGQSCIDTIIRKDSVYFVFRNIYLPGLQQDGNSDPDSTKGFVRYRLQFDKKLKKLPFESSAAIIFDKNEPIYTNKSTGYFKPGKSPGVIIGYNRWIDKEAKFFDDRDDLVVGACLSSFSPYKKYFQWELFATANKTPEQLISRGPGNDTLINGQICRQQNIDRYAKENSVRLYIVPIQLRYNFFDWLGGGIGALAATDAMIKISSRKEILLICPPNQVMSVAAKDPNHTEFFKNWDFAAFGDVQLGKVRVGPAIGLRFIHYFRIPQNHLFVYAAWRL